MRWLAVPVVLLVALSVASIAYGQLTISFTIEIQSVDLSVAEDGPVDLLMTDIDHEPVGAWQVDVGFDSTIVSLESCSPVADNAVCDLERGKNTVRVVGASATGISEDTTLATLTFRCEAVGTSPLTLAAVGGSAIPEDIVEVETREGSISCSEASATPSPTALLTTPALPATGIEPERAASVGQLVWALVAAGVAATVVSIAIGIGRRR